MRISAPLPLHIQFSDDSGRHLARHSAPSPADGVSQVAVNTGTLDSGFNELRSTSICITPEFPFLTLVFSNLSQAPGRQPVIVPTDFAGVIALALAFPSIAAIAGDASPRAS
jgi:hypothetical protein